MLLAWNLIYEILGEMYVDVKKVGSGTDAGIENQSDSALNFQLIKNA